MEFTALCFRLTLLCSGVVVVLLLMPLHVHRSYAQETHDPFPHVIPRRLQFFEWESISFICVELGGLSGWKVVREVEGETKLCSDNSQASLCTIDLTFTSDSGEYWCEADGEQRTETLTIIVTAGSVILESPPHPVTEGDSVTLHCRSRTQSDVTADFYKNGNLIGTGQKGKMSISNISRSDEGLYRCSISGSGDSAESRLTVRALFEDPSHNPSLHPSLLPCIVVPLLLVLVLVVVGVRLYRRNRGTFSSSSSPSSSPLQTDPGVCSCSGTPALSAGINSLLTEDDSTIYYTIQY